MTRRELFTALAPVYLSVFLFVAGNSALTVLIPVYLSEHGHLSTAQIGLVVGAFGLSSRVVAAARTHAARRVGRCPRDVLHQRAERAAEHLLSGARSGGRPVADPDRRGVEPPLLGVELVALRERAALPALRPGRPDAAARRARHARDRGDPVGDPDVRR